MSKELAEWRDKHLNSISNSFWQQSGISLFRTWLYKLTFMIPHPIDLEEIKTNPYDC